MRFPYSFKFSVLALLCLKLFTSSNLAAGDDWKEWRPLDPKHIALKAPVVEKDADAEALFWEVRVADELEGGSPRTVLTHYIRIKIFTELGRESQSRVDIPFGKVGKREFKIKDIAGRTIKHDGSIVELKKEDIFERTIIKSGGTKIKAKSFAMPGVEPGAIIEYRWREIRGDNISFYDRLEFSREIPVQFVKYYVKPLSVPGLSLNMRMQTFNGQTTPFVKEKNDFYSTSMSNVPAFREEPHMPPEYAVRPWMLIYYSLNRNLSPNQYWYDYGRRKYEETKSLLKVNDEVRKAATEIIGDATDPEQKLKRLFNHCRFNIKRIFDDASGMTADQLKKVKDNKSPADTIKRGMGTDMDIDTLFGALAAAAGFEVRVACVSDREDIFFDKGFADDYFIAPANIAVKVGDKWKFYNPANTYVPYGMLRWQEEGQEALITDANEPAWVKTPHSAPEKSLQKRVAKLRLNTDGTIEGDVTIEYTGHFAVDHKEYNDDDTTTEREETLKESVKKRVSTAELSNVRIENVTDPIKPFIQSYHIRIPNYAQRTGKRLLLQPAFFQYNKGPLFPNSNRHHLIYFHYPWSEEDRVEIELPEGFELDNAEAPSRFGAHDLSQYDVKISLIKDPKQKPTLVYSRKFFFGGQGKILFPTEAFKVLKQFFDELHKQDNHTISLKLMAQTTSSQN